MKTEMFWTLRFTFSSSPLKFSPIFDEIFGGDGDFSRLGQKFVREEEDVERKNYEDPQNESPSISSSEVIRGSWGSNN